MAGIDPNTDATAYILVAILTCITTVLVALIGRRVSPKLKFRSASYYSGYDKWATYMEKELAKEQAKVELLQKEVEKFKEKLYEEKQASQRMRSKLLWFGRKYDVDVSDVI